MSGHNKWSTIKQKKGKNDAARAKVFTKIGRELIVAIKEGGSADPSVNSKLKDCIAKAKAAAPFGTAAFLYVENASGAERNRVGQILWLLQKALPPNMYSFARTKEYQKGRRCP